MSNELLVLHVSENTILVYVLSLNVSGILLVNNSLVSFLFLPYSKNIIIPNNIEALAGEPLVCKIRNGTSLLNTEKRECFYITEQLVDPVPVQ
jgi:hypothetical protein